MIDRSLVYYGLFFAVVLFIAGYLTGMGGSFVMNLLTSVFLGAAIALSLALVKKYGGMK